MNPADFMLLVVDDDRGLVRLMQRALERNGFKTSAAYSGAEALEWLRRQTASLLLLDLKLSDMDGTELISRLAEQRLTVPFIVITGQGDERVAVEMMKRGAVDYLVKDTELLEFLPPVVARVAAKIQTERRLVEAEEQIHLVRTALDQAHDAVLITRPGEHEPEIVFANPAFFSLTGLREDEVVGKSISRFAGIVADWQRLCSCLQAGKDVFAETVIHSLASGPREVEWRSTPVRDSSGAITHCISIQRDVTERKRLEHEILQISDREQQRIGQDLHDGLGQHLAGIELMSQVLEQSLERKNLPEAAQAARIAKYVREAITQTKQLARGLSPVELDANGLTAALETLAARASDLFGVRCEFVPETPLLVRDNAAATQIYRIVQEAINNAVKHGRARRVTIATGPAETGFLRVLVIDNGSGFNPEEAGSAGLGLQIMRHRAGMIGAALSIRSTPQGTTVACELRKDV